MIFITNKYYYWYYRIIEKSKSRDILEDTEKHHIIPRSLGGSNSLDNISNLTCREHFICHILLTKFTSGLAQEKMIFAANMMSNFRKYNSKSYASLKQKHRKMLKEKFSGKNHPLYGKKQSEQTIQKRLANTNRELLKSQLGKKGKDHPAYGNVMSKESREKLSKALKGKKKPEGCQKGAKNNNYGKRHPGLNSGESNAMYGKKGILNPSFLKNLPRYKIALSMLRMNASVKDIVSATGFNRNLIAAMRAGKHYICQVDLNAF